MGEAGPGARLGGFVGVCGRVVALDSAGERILARLRRGDAGVDGWIGALAQKVLSVLVWNHGLLLATMAKVLVLCCPLVILFAGFVIMRSVTHAEEAASIQEQGTSAEGDDR